MSYTSEYLKAITKPLPQLAETFKEEIKYLQKAIQGAQIVTDVGCGARPLHILAKQSQEKHFIGIDNNSSMIQEALWRTEEFLNANIKQGDILNSKLPDKFSDVTFSTFNLIGSIDPERKERLIQEKKRITKGKIITITWKIDKKTTEFLKKYYPSIGLEIRRISELDFYTSKEVFRRIRPQEIIELYKKNKLSATYRDIGPLWYAIEGHSSRK